MKKKSFRTRVREAIFGIPEPVEIKQGNAILSKVKQSHGETISTSLASQVNIYNEDAVVKESILQMAEQVCSGGGFFVKGDEKYSVKLPIADIGEMTALEYINYWNEQNNLDYVLLQASIELIAFGNSFWNITNGLKEIPVKSIQKAVATTKLTPITDEYHLQTTYEYGNKKLMWGSFLHFKSNTVGFAPFGSGIILGLIAAPTDGTAPSLYEVRKSVRKSMKCGFEKFSFGNEMWTFEGLSDDRIDTLQTSINDMEETGNRIATNVRGDIKLAVPQRTQSYDKWIEQIAKEFYQALSAGISPETEYTTKATAEAVRETYMMKIQSLRRVLKRNIEALWRKILEEAGFSGYKAKLRLHFGSEEIEYVTTDVFTAVEKGILSPEEARVILRENMKWKITEDLPEDLQKPEEKVEDNEEETEE